MRVSIFTPSHDTRWLGEVYESIKNQPFSEWVILLNLEARLTEAAVRSFWFDPRVKVHRLTEAVDGVGAAKKMACEKCTGDILLELDHDDLLMPGAIDEVLRAFKVPGVVFAYSNAVHMNMDGTERPKFGDGNGWEYRRVKIDGKDYNEIVAFPPLPSSVARIWYAPDHLRAWRRDAYERIGGHAPMRVLDDLDLMCRLFQEGLFYHIDKPLYIYRVHGGNTWLRYNAEIQSNVPRIFEQYIERMALKWAYQCELLALDLGGRFNRAKGFKSVDLHDADFIANLNLRWPFDDGSVGVVRAYDVFEHLSDSIHTMKELFRVLAPNGIACIQVPSTDGRGAFQDPTHVSFWNENSMLYYTNIQWAKYIDVPVRFQNLLTYTTKPDANGVCWVRSFLLKLDDDHEHRPPGPINI